LGDILDISAFTNPFFVMPGGTISSKALLKYLHRGLLEALDVSMVIAEDLIKIT